MRDRAPKPKDLASADIYLDVVQPALERAVPPVTTNSKRVGRPFRRATTSTLMKVARMAAVIEARQIPRQADLFRA